MLTASQLSILEMIQNIQVRFTPTYCTGIYQCKNIKVISPFD